MKGGDDTYKSQSMPLYPNHNTSQTQSIFRLGSEDLENN